MSDHISAAAFRTGPVRAVVRAGSSDTTYIRVGAGECVLLLVADLDAPLSNALLEALGAHFRVIAPVTRPSQADFSVWLNTFLDGLGIGSANLISHDGLAANAIAFAFLEPGRIERLVLIADHTPDGTQELGGSLADPSQHASHPLMIVSASEAPGEVADRVIRFLTGEPAEH